MYTTCLFCNHDLGRNELLPTFPVGRRLAFDSAHGRLWVVCPHCARWNLTPVEERWEAIERCERLFRASHLRYSTAQVGLAELRDGVELVRVGKPARPELAAWRYGRLLRRGRRRPEGEGSRAVVPTAAIPAAAERLLDAAITLGGQAAAAIARAVPHPPLGYDARTWLHLRRQAGRVLDVVELAGTRAVVRYGHLERAALLRPERGEPWQLVVPHDAGAMTLTGAAGLRTAGKLLAGINRVGVTGEAVALAVRKIEDAGNPDDYFNRVVVGIALRTSWGRRPFAPSLAPLAVDAAGDAEQLALYLTNRSFWARGAIGSEPRTPLPRLPLVDRLALEMAAHEDLERRALEGELAELERAWRDAEAIAAIADQLPTLVAGEAATRVRGAARRLGALLSPPVAGPAW